MRTAIQLSLIILAGFLWPNQSFAEPATIDITPTFIAPAGSVPIDGYRVHTNCDLAAQTSVPIPATVVSGGTVQLSGDTDAVYNLCVRAFNVSGDFAFDVVDVLSHTPPTGGPVQGLTIDCPDYVGAEGTYPCAITRQ